MKNKTKALGYFTFFAGLLLLFFPFNLSLATILGKLKCGERYMQPVDGIIGDVSCGFNMDMALSVAALALILVGLALIVSAKVRAKAHKG